MHRKHAIQGASIHSRVIIILILLKCSLKNTSQCLYFYIKIGIEMMTGVAIHFCYKKSHSEFCLANIAVKGDC